MAGIGDSYSVDFVKRKVSRDKVRCLARLLQRAEAWQHRMQHMQVSLGRLVAVPELCPFECLPDGRQQSAAICTPAVQIATHKRQRKVPNQRAREPFKFKAAVGSMLLCGNGHKGALNLEFPEL